MTAGVEAIAADAYREAMGSEALTSDRHATYLVSLVNELRSLPGETDCVEFKLDDAEPKSIGEYISALANASALAGKALAYVVWGVRDADHAVMGTRFDPSSARVGNEQLEQIEIEMSKSFPCFPGSAAPPRNGSLPAGRSNGAEDAKIPLPFSVARSS